MLRRFGRFLIGGYDASVKRAPRLGSLFLFVELVDEFVPFASKGNRAPRALRRIDETGALEQFERQGVLEALLDDALERTRAIFRLVTQIGDRVESGVGDREVDSLFREKRLQLFRLNLDDLTNLILFQRMENDRFVDTVEEFRKELVA